MQYANTRAERIRRLRTPSGLPRATIPFKDPSKRRTSSDQITFFHSLGLLGFQFAAVAGKTYMLAREREAGREISSEPFLQDIRD